MERHLTDGGKGRWRRNEVPGITTFDRDWAAVTGQSDWVTRAPFQVLVIPFRRSPSLRFCVLQRADSGLWQWIAGGGEDTETPLEAAEREVAEEVGPVASSLRPLDSQASVPVDSFASRAAWPASIAAIPEYAFALEMRADPCLSAEHIGFAWLDFDTAYQRLRWDSNRSALWELRERLRPTHPND